MTDKNIRRFALIFLAAVVVIGVLCVGALIIRPYDNGTLSSCLISSNLVQGGRVCANSAYEVYADGKAMYRYSASEQTTERIADGDISYINTADGALYYVMDNKIYQGDYLGLKNEVLFGDVSVNALSVNGYWLYFSTPDGRLFKMRRDASDVREISPEGLKVESFTADNRHVLFISDGTLYAMGSDGKNAEKIDDGVEKFVYTADNLYYLKDGKINLIFQYIAKFEKELYPEYEPISADVYAYCFDENGEGLIYYADDNKLMVRKLYAVGTMDEENVGEETIKVCDFGNDKITAIYPAGYHIYVYTDKGFYRVEPDTEYVGEVERLD